MFGRVWAIALNTFREAARVKVLYGIVAVVAAANLLAMVLGEMSMRESARVARDVGLAGISFFGALTAIFLGVFLLFVEVQRRTIHSIVSKPLARWEFVIGKYGGMALILSVLVVLFAGAMYAQLAWQGVPLTSTVVKATCLAFCEVLVVAAVAIFFSSFSSPFLSGLFALAVFALGRLTPDIEAAVKIAKAEWIQGVAGIALRIFPDLHLFSISGRTLDGSQVSVHGDFVSWGYVGASALHGACWIVGLLLIAAAIFERRDFV